MKIVIDIPEKIYNRYINYTESYIDFMFIGTEEILVKAIRNGTPLPKGSGRLIDADALIKQLKATANIEWNKKVGSSKGLIDAIDIVDDIPIIIEADKESD